MPLFADVQRTLALAWPIILANAAVPLLGLVDTAVIGHWGNRDELAALAICNLIFNFLYWALGFLRMSTTGLVAQAAGAGQQQEVYAVAVRGTLLGASLGLTLIVCQSVFLTVALFWLDASVAVEAQVQTYFQARIWGAPAALVLYVCTGLLIGLGRTHQLLLLQLAMTALNIFLDCVLVFTLDQKVFAVGLGTALTEWTIATVVGLWILRRHSMRFVATLSTSRTLRSREMYKLLATNRDIFIRTLFLLLTFAWFTNASAAFGSEFLAANHILLGFISFSAFFLDAFAFVAEAAVGKAIGERDRPALQRALWATSVCAVFAAGGLFIVLLATGNWLIALMTDLPTVNDVASDLLHWAALYVLLSVAAFQLDGIFIGATAGRAMRDASVLAFFAFVVAWWTVVPRWGIGGLWLSFVVHVCARAGFLLMYWKQVSGQVESVGNQGPLFK